MAATKPYRYSYRLFNGNRKYDPYGLCEKDPSEEYLDYGTQWTSQAHENQTPSSIQDYQYNGHHSSSQSDYSTQHHTYKHAESVYSYGQDNSLDQVDFQQTSDQQPYHTSTQYTHSQLSSSKKFNSQQSFDQTVYRQTSGDVQVPYDSHSQTYRAKHSQNDHFYQDKISNGYQKADSSNLTNHSNHISSEYENSQYHLESTHSYHNGTVYHNNEYNHMPQLVQYDMAKPQDRWSKALEHARSYYRNIALYNVHNSYDSTNSVYQPSHHDHHHDDPQHPHHHDHHHQTASTTKIPDRNFNPREMWSKAIYLASPSHNKYDPYKMTGTYQESSKTDAFHEKSHGYGQYEGFGSNTTGGHHHSSAPLSYESYQTNPDSMETFEEENNNYRNYNSSLDNGNYYGTDDSSMENEEHQSYEFDPILIDYLKSLAQVYAMDERQQLLWEQEMYNQLKYKSPRSFFHTFEAEFYQAGINFANEDEAAKFVQVVRSKILERQKKKEERRNQQNVQRNQQSNTTQNNITLNKAPLQKTPDTGGSTQHGTLKKSTLKKEKKKSRLTKQDIGQPTNFRHIKHLGWDPDCKKVDINQMEEHMKQLLESIGLTANQEVDKETLSFIYDFVEKNGGIDAVKKEMDQKQNLPPPPQQSLPPRHVGPPTPARSAAPPPVPPSRAAAPVPPSRSVPTR
ncbi:putative uncharacterized protein DDB_G0282499, partial [Octopus bimaculoides]